ncbi:PAS domain S-box-containing protein/diguanylate cyclase (GGDEF) domain-containing protein [Massilia sp. PDC64]|nr:EAL domain-containing protein [Massilia sp. PDC64]SDD45741.1 PAS domain S-box-containing protein/diguanylate cyclase (GGDEF) domain-containing protein [Massilia sp. PDC64]
MARPLTKGGANRMTTTHKKEMAGRPYEILVAEDSPTQAEHLARVLAQDPHCPARVRVAADGEVALHLARELAPDLVVSDIAMPRMDGYALCRALKDDPQLAGVPVLLLTRLTTLQDIVRSLEAGADGFLPKPYDADQLRERVRRILQGRDAGDPARPLEVMADERRRIYELLVATHEDTLRLNADLARMVDSLALLGRIAGALNEAAGETDVARAALDHLITLPALAGAAISTATPDGAMRVLAQRGDGPVPSACTCADGSAADDPAQLCLPLLAGTRQLGRLHVRARHRAFDAEDRELLAGVAQQVALALERARLYTRAEALVVERTTALRSERNRLSAIIETAGTLVLMADSEGRIVTFNRACEESLGWRAEQAMGRRCWEVIRGAADPDVVRRLFAGLAKAPPPRLQGEWLTPDGRTRSIVWTHTLLRREDGSVEFLLATGIDVTALRGAEQRLHRASNYDAVTGLPNRDLLRERLRRMKAEAQAGRRILGFMLLRFGRMALIREALGPDAEQGLLQEAAARLREVAGQDIVASFSEGTFALALVRADADELAASARRVLAALGVPYRYQHDEFHLDPSIGIAIYPNDGVAYETLARGAETALRQAADGMGQRYAFYRPELNRDANDRFKLENALRRAVERHELEIHYQPQIAVDGESIVSAEALLRWRHPERGLVPPHDFIPLAEETGLILEIGEWVLHEVCCQLQAWRRAGLPVVPVAVNLSAHQFNERICGTVRRVLDDCGLEPGMLELELTESASMADPNKSVALLAQLKAMGIRLAIDDFGTGYSNLNYLKRFPVDRIKIDRSFVRDLETDPDDLAIASAVVAMAHGLRLSVVAEGVETTGQLALLAGLGCDLVQGWLFSRAVPAEEFAALLTAGHMPAAA